MRGTGRKPPQLLLVLAFVVGFACAPSHHTVEPYRSQPELAAALEAKAARICSQARPSAPAPTRAFVTDGCSAWPDAKSWVQCCVDHDIPYWCGGSREQRERADAVLRACVSERYRPWMGRVMLWGVRVGGHPRQPAHWRWGFGRAYPDVYSEELQ